jgi:hypothetical protein
MNMNICKQLSKFDIETVTFNNTLKNKIIKDEDSLFTSINVNLNNVYLNNVCLLFSINDPKIFPYNTYNTTYGNQQKYKCYFDKTKNKSIYYFIENIEDMILNKYCSVYNKKEFEKKLSIKNNDCGKCYIKYYITPKSTNSIVNRYSFNNSCVKINKTDTYNQLFVIKISGVWETGNTIGVSYKICSI